MQSDSMGKTLLLTLAVDGAERQTLGLFHESFIGSTGAFGEVTQGTEMEETAGIAKATVVPDRTEVRAKHRLLFGFGVVHPNIVCDRRLSPTLAAHEPFIFEHRDLGWSQSGGSGMLGDPLGDPLAGFWE
jgi:hypothetical protein